MTGLFCKQLLLAYLHRTLEIWQQAVPPNTSFHTTANNYVNDSCQILWDKNLDKLKPRAASDWGEFKWVLMNPVDTNDIGNLSSWYWVSMKNLGWMAKRIDYHVSCHQGHGFDSGKRATCTKFKLFIANGSILLLRSCTFDTLSKTQACY